MSDLHEDHEKDNLFARVCELELASDRDAIAIGILNRFGRNLTEDELRFVVEHIDGPVAKKAALMILFRRSRNPVVLGIIAKACPELEDRVWKRIQRVFRKDVSGRDIFLEFCPALRGDVRDLEFRRKNPHLEHPPFVSRRTSRVLAA